MTGSPYVLEETTWKSVKETDFEIAILPWGATEAHNFHLPYGTDNLETERIAIESSRLAWERGAKVIVLPTLPIGVNIQQIDIKVFVAQAAGSVLFANAVGAHIRKFDLKFCNAAVGADQGEQAVLTLQGVEGEKADACKRPDGKQGAGDFPALCHPSAGTACRHD